MSDIYPAAAGPVSVGGRIRALIPPMDGSTVLTVYLVLQLVVPSDRGVGALGGAGSPASLFALAMLLWWVWDQVHRPRDQGRLYLRLVILGFCLCVLASYIVAALSSLPLLDGNAADRGLLRAGSFVGIVLVACDGIPSRERLLILLRRVVTLGGLYAALGLAQFVTKQNLVNLIQIPGLSGDDLGLISRVGFVRPQATAVHPLEYASVLSIILPIALALAMHDTSRRSLTRWLPVVAITLASVLSTSRSGLIGTAVGLLILWPSWKPSVRRWAAMFAAAGVAAIYVLIPGMLGTIVGLFSGGNGDSSIVSRTDSYGLVLKMWLVHPYFGRGFGTFLPTYHILDNQYLMTLVDVGAVGLAITLALSLVAIVTVIRSKSSEHPLWRALAPALCASVVAGSVLAAFFDSYSFTQASGLLFMVTGLCGAYYTTARGAQQSVGAAVRASAPRRAAERFPAAVVRRWYVTAVVVASAVAAMFYARQVTGVYYTSYNILFLAPPSVSAGNPLWTGSDGMVQYAGMVSRLTSNAVRQSEIAPTSAPLYGTGLRSTQRVYLPNAGNQWSTSFTQAAVTVEVVRPTPEQVRAAAASITRTVEREAAVPQQRLHVRRRVYITTELSPAEPVIQYIPARNSRAMMALALLAMGSAVLAANLVDQLLVHRLRNQRFRQPRHTLQQTNP